MTPPEIRASLHPAQPTPTPTARGDTPRTPLAVGDILRDKQLFVIGGTGFLGKVWLSLLLDRYPEIGRIHLVVRPKDGQDPETRFYSEILPSPVFDPLRERYGGSLHRFVEEKVHSVAADISRENMGLDESLLRDFEGRIDAVVNASGLVDFDPPIDEALEANAFGIQKLVAFARRIGDVPIFHTSTCYVVGTRNGVIKEDDPRAYPFPRADDLDKQHWSPATEIAECMDLVRMARHRTEDAFRQSTFLDEAKQRLRDRGEPARGPALEDELTRVKRRFIRKTLSEAGLERARFWGWMNTYTYTKSIGEQILLESGLRVAIGRPSVIESSLAYPFPGWNEGINTSAPVIFLAMKGQVQIPARDGVNLDMIPVDMVASGMIASLAALIQGTNDAVYQYGTSDTNPCSMDRFIELTGLVKRRRYKSGRGTGNPLVDFVQAHIEPVMVSRNSYERWGASALGRYAKAASEAMRKAAVGPARTPLALAATVSDRYASLASKAGEILDVFLPFIYDNVWEFRCDHTRSLFARMPESDRDRLVWAPESIDWRHWFMEIHVPALERWVEPLLEQRLNPPKKALRRHDHLWALADEMAERHEHAPALQFLVARSEIERLSFVELRDRALGVAAALHELGVRSGDRVILSGKNHPAWPIAYFGIVRAGATVVPVDPEIDAGALRNIARTAEARAALLDAHAAESGAPVLAELAVPLLDLHEIADRREGPPPPALELRASDVASLIFTSGTTGTPKGVMLTHDNFTSLLAALAPIFPLGEGDSALSVLPLHHTFEFACGMLLPIAAGARITYLDELTGERLSSGLKAGRVTAMVGVPALWQLLERRIAAQVAERGAVAKLIFELAGAMNRSLGMKLGVDAGRLLFGPVHAALGGKLRYLVSGGAALPEDTHAFFAGLGLHLTEGYGLTEAAPVLTVSQASARAKPGHVGKAIPGVDVKIDAPDERGVGEVLARGPNVMLGYAGGASAQDETRRVLTEDGWLRTGDLGKVDHHGRLTIVGRAKDVIVGANGENVYPDDVEALLGTPEHVAELCVLGVTDSRGRELVACLASPAKVEGLDHAGRVALAEASLRKAIRALPQPMRPVVVHYYDAALPRTATRKVKRKECRAIVDRLSGANVTTTDDAALTPVRRAIATVSGRKTNEVHEHARLAADLGLDSLGMVELVAALDAIETAAGRAAVDGERVLECETVADVETAVGAGSNKDRSSRRYEIKDAEDSQAPLEVPEPVRELAKTAMSGVQMAFYEKVMRTRVSGRAFVPQNRSVIVVSNHTSHLDLGAVKYALGEYGRDLVTLAAKDYFFESWRKPFFENFTNVVGIERFGGTRESLDRAAEIIAQGKTVLVFPEGTRSRSGMMADFKAGVGYLALKTGVDILPVHIGGAFEALPKGRPLPTKRELHVRIGPVLSIETLRAKTAGMRRDDAAKVVARAAQLGVAALRDGKVFALDAWSPESEASAAAVAVSASAQVQSLFAFLEGRFVPGAVKTPVTFYFTLGDDDALKWTVRVEPARCVVRRGKPDGGPADCVVKTSASMLERIVRHAYVPTPAEFMSGAVKTNSVENLTLLATAFVLGPSPQIGDTKPPLNPPTSRRF